MRIQRIKISKWRHFENIELDVPEAAPVVCLVGGNGTGKTQILDLIAASAQHIGLSHGFESGRGSPFSDVADVEVQFQIATGIVPGLDEANDGVPESLLETREHWDRTLLVKYTETAGVSITAGGVEDPFLANQLAQHLVGLIRSSAAVHYLKLDADRAYPKIELQAHEWGPAIETDWDGTLKSRSFASTKNLYEEWFRYLLGSESRDNNAHIAAIRIARERGGPEPAFVDKMESYKNSIKKVLPHLIFTGIISQAKQIRFDSTGVPLSFDQLSGGEREIAFLVGQIERFGLHKGLLLVDEPELHLNYDLLRSWIGFLKETVKEGQIWLATHSLEVVEVTGQDATFLLERDETTRKVVLCTPLASRPVVSTLSRAVGSPAFSIATLTFILIEGEEEIGERERFRALTLNPRDVRFIEAGNCREVMRRLDSLQSIAKASGEPLKLGGIVDRDWRNPGERDALSAQGLHVLPVHEVENFFLHPPTIRHVIASIAGDPNGYDEILAAAVDTRAGALIFDAARTTSAFEKFPPPHTDVRELVHQLNWSQFTDLPARAQEIADADRQLDADQRALMKKHLEVRAAVYQRLREEGGLWKVCDGKEVFRRIAPEIGFADADTAERAILGAWAQNPDLVPDELTELRLYVETIRGA